MDRGFYVLIKMKSPVGWSEFGRLYLGDEPELAYATFNRLKGRPQGDGWLRLDLVENRGQTNARLQWMYCTLEELTENSRLITRETFKLVNLEKDPVPTPELLAV